MRSLSIIFAAFILIVCCKSKPEQIPIVKNTNNGKHALFVVSNASFYGNTDIETTNNFPEIVYAYHEFVKADISVDFVSPEGGQIPIGYIYSSDSLLQHYLFSESLFEKLKNTLNPSEIAKDQYQAIYYVGGGAAMFGVPENRPLQEIAQHIVEKNNGTLSAICHGTAGIVNIKTSKGFPLINGKRITGFPDAFEDTTATYYRQFPFSINKAINDQGASFKYSEDGWDGYFIEEGNIITGQDPTSAHLVAQAVIKNILEKTE